MEKCFIYPVLHDSCLEAFFLQKKMLHAKNSETLNRFRFLMSISVVVYIYFIWSFEESRIVYQTRPYGRRLGNVSLGNSDGKLGRGRHKVGVAVDG